jgi:hypothetical protein
VLVLLIGTVAGWFGSRRWWKHRRGADGIYLEDVAVGMDIVRHAEAVAREHDTQARELTERVHHERNEGTPKQILEAIARRNRSRGLY